MTTPASQQRGRLVSWAGFVFGSVSSIAANVLHTWLPAGHMPHGWTPGIAPQIGAAVWPIGLLLSVEVLSRARWQSGWLWALARYGGAGAVAVGSAIISYSHLRDVLLTWGYGRLAAGVGPLTLDGLMIVCGFALLSMTLARETTPAVPEPVGEPAAPATLTVSVAEPGDRSPVPAWPHGEPVVAPDADTGHTPAPRTSVPDIEERGPVRDDLAEDGGADTRRERARELSAQGWTHARIAAHLGVSKRTVRRYLSTPATSSPDPIRAHEAVTESGLTDQMNPPESPAPDTAAGAEHYQPFEGVLV